MRVAPLVAQAAVIAVALAGCSSEPTTTTAVPSASPAQPFVIPTTTPTSADPTPAPTATPPEVKVVAAQTGCAEPITDLTREFGGISVICDLPAGDAGSVSGRFILFADGQARDRYVADRNEAAWRENYEEDQDLRFITGDRWVYVLNETPFAQAPPRLGPKELKEARAAASQAGGTLLPAAIVPQERFGRSASSVASTLSCGQTRPGPKYVFGPPVASSVTCARQGRPLTVVTFADWGQQAGVMDRFYTRVLLDGLGPARVWYATGPGYLVFDPASYSYESVAPLAANSLVGSVSAGDCEGFFGGSCAAPTMFPTTYKATNDCADGCDRAGAQAAALKAAPRRWSAKGFTIRDASVDPCDGLRVEISGDLDAAQATLRNVPYVNLVYALGKGPRVDCT